MVSIKEQIVVITGASSGIGAACAKQFAQEGASLILAARRKEKLEAVAAEIKATYKVKTHLLEMDVSDRATVETTLASLPEPWNKVDILVNNAGLSRGMDKLQEGDIQNWEEMIDTNVKGLLYVTRSLLPGMVARNQGHIINIGSIAGHQAYPGGNVYCATKAAVRALSEGLKMDLFATPIRVSSVDPGTVETDFSKVRFRGDIERAKKVYEGMNALTPQDIAEIVVFCATRPSNVNISELLVLATDQSSATMVNRSS
ncbi:NADP-dependent 3-hydroxy acid dehydrogenase YdfG [Hyella patelloides LEGE 07179]|uniref:NADP-dependent 3-hydroxy acid dehydrogenase YdfG n=1 Tax=Hyella patelloides LEGE 07179 TaxID=945734 RepID=A0A563VY50_9CYAN|nr:SDR family oxidoreductase [Hyella patelloides]VEP16351.1 NADP-dependent 3-hydroxy acid dehydrogenase YdfG [Hyella patelloides LEGE 07179]